MSNNMTYAQALTEAKQMLVQQVLDKTCTEPGSANSDSRVRVLYTPLLYFFAIHLCPLLA